MTNQELLDNIIGFMAFDEGDIDCGISDNVLKALCRQLVDERREELDKTFTDYVRLLLTEGSEYDLEDVFRFLTYLGDEFNWDVR